MRYRLLVLASLLSLSACGSSDSEGAVASAAETTTTEQAEQTTTTVAADGDLEAFCLIAIDASAADSAFDSYSDPEAVEEYFANQLDLLDQAIAAVPNDMRADYEAIQVTGETITTVLAANDYDFFGSLADLQGVMDDADYNAALERSKQFEFDECGIAIDDDEAEDDSDLGDEMSDIATDDMLALLETETGRKLFVEGIAEESGMTIDEASCFIDNIDVAAFLQLGGEPTGDQMVEMLEAFDTCDIDPSLLTG